jgi:glycosyltransferase involved in cell wall biosynthesis
MKVLFLCNIPAPYRIDFFNELGKECELTVVFEAETTPFATFNYNLDDIRNFTAHFVRKGDIRERRVDWGILPYLNGRDYDCVVVTNYAYYTEAAAILALKLKGVPYYMELDGGIIRKENPLLRWGKKMLIRGARGYFSTGAPTDEFLHAYAGEKIRICRYPFTSTKKEEVLDTPPSKEEKSRLREELGYTRPHLILSIGMFTRRKGFDLLMDASVNFREEADVCIIGGQATQDYLEQRDRLHLDNVHFLPFQGKEALERYYQAADLFALATREDVWGLVVNEAMARGLPVVTTDKCVAGLEMVREGENGYLIPSERVDLLAQRMGQILKDPALGRRMSLSALDTARRYTLEQMAAAHMEQWKADLYGTTETVF